jgi:hypothetical protein
LWVIAQGSGDAIAAGFTLVPLLAGWALGSSMSVKLLVAHGTRAVFVGAFAVAFLGALALAAVAATGLPTSWALASLGLLGFGLGPAASASIIAPQSCVPWRYRAAVTSTIFASRMLGGSIAVAALGTLGAAGHGAARFAGIAVLAVGGLVASAAVAPRGVQVEPGEIMGSAAE